MISIDYKERFDAVINLFYSLGFFEADKKNLKVLKNFYKALKRNGKFLFHTDVNLPRVLKGNYKEDETRELDCNNKLRIIEHYNSKTKRMNGSWAIKRKDGTEAKKNYSVRVYTKDEFIEMCTSVGFKNCKAYSNWKGSGYSGNAEDMIIVAYK